MKRFILFSLFTITLVIPSVDVGAKENGDLDYGNKCDPAKNQCAEGLGCYKGVCSYKPSKVGEPCGGVTLTPRLCEQGLVCVYDKAAGKTHAGVCQKRKSK